MFPYAPFMWQKGEWFWLVRALWFYVVIRIVISKVWEKRADSLQSVFLPVFRNRLWCCSPTALTKSVRAERWKSEDRDRVPKPPPPTDTCPLVPLCSCFWSFPVLVIIKPPCDVKRTATICKWAMVQTGRKLLSYMLCHAANPPGFCSPGNTSK